MIFDIVNIDSVLEFKSLVWALCALLLISACWVLYARLLHPLCKVPGPFSASITQLYYVYKVLQGSYDKVNRRWHAQYGPVVRIAPNEVSINDPEAVNLIYGTKSKFTKSEFYGAWRVNIFDTKHLDQFSDPDEAHHSSRRRILNNVYSMSSILESETYINTCTETFMERISEHADSSEKLDLGLWFQMYAFDVIGELYFGSSFGFVKTSSDWVAVLPTIYRPLYLLCGMAKSSVRRAVASMTALQRFAKQKVRERETLLKSNVSEEATGRKDILAKLFQITVAKGQRVDFKVPDIEQEGYTGLLAGSDTTAIAMRAIIIKLLTHPKAMETLLTELDDAHRSGELPIPIAYNAALKLPFFNACVKESMRLHPSIGLQLSRHPPANGVQIAGYYLPESTRVGINATVLHYNEEIFGADAGQFVPERWLTDKASYMDRYLLTFGGGTRTCIALAEIQKLLPRLLLDYRLELADPNNPLTTYDWWFYKQENVIVKVYRR